MASSQQPMDSDAHHQGDFCTRVMKKGAAAAIKDTFSQPHFATSGFGNDDYGNGEATTLETICKPATNATRSCTSATPVTPRRIVIPSNDIHTVRDRMPPTPDQTPSHGIKRSFSAALAEGSPAANTQKLFGVEPEKSPTNSPFRRNSIPKFSILYKHRPSKSLVVSAVELKRASEAVLRQVDWEVVEEEVASNRGAAVYKKVIKGILQERIENLIGLEAEE